MKQFYLPERLKRGEVSPRFVFFTSSRHRIHPFDLCILLGFLVRNLDRGEGHFFYSSLKRHLHGDQVRRGAGHVGRP